MDNDLHRDARRSFIPKLSRASPLFLLAGLTDFDSRPLDFRHPPRRYSIHPCSQRASTGGACWRSGGGACGFGLASRASGGLGRHRPAQLHGSVRQRAGGADESGRKPVESRAFEWAPLSVSRRRSRGLRKNAAVERREARRSALWIGNPVRRRERPCRKAGQWARRSAPANFGAPLPSVGGAKGSKPTIWHDSPPGCAARQRSRTPQTCMEKGNSNAEVCADDSPPSCPALCRASTPCLRQRKAWMAGT